MRQRTVLQRWPIIMTEAQANWDVWEYWERQRFESMAANLQHGMTLFDVGTEHGSISAVYARFVGARNMHLFEPSPALWPSIRATWEANGYAPPAGCWPGLVGTVVEGAVVSVPVFPSVWPSYSVGPIEDRNTYRYLHDDGPDPVISLDAWASVAGDPDAITVDVEGAEGLVIAGALGCIERARPLVWVSIHPDLIEKDYPEAPRVPDMMRALGYEQALLGVDHEEHWLFWHPEKHDPEFPPLGGIVAR